MEARRLASEKIDLLFVDYSLPGSNGLELVRWFQFMFPKTEALVTADSLWELLYQSGAQAGYVALAKPFTHVELDQILHKTLR